MKKVYLKPSFKTFEVEEIKLLQGTNPFDDTTGTGTGSQGGGGGD